MSALVRGRVNGDDRLIEADAQLAELNQRAGAEAGGPLLIPPLAAIVRLTRTLGIPLSRAVWVADGDQDLDLWVNARAEGDDVVLSIAEWQVREPADPIFGAGLEQRISRLAAVAPMAWECDGDLNITRVAVRDARLPAPMSQRPAPFGDVFRLLADNRGHLAMIDAVSDNRSFERQRATLVAAPTVIVELSGVALGGMGRPFMGFSGIAAIVPVTGTAEQADQAAKPLIGDAFAERLETALRQPLGRIIANAETIRTQHDGPMLPGYLDYAGDIANAGRHLLGLLDDLVDLEYIERDDFTVINEAVDLADVARRAAGLLGVKALERDIRLNLPPQGDRFVATAEFRRVLQILVNLIGNAIRHSPDGGTIRVEAARIGGMIALTVADQGVGIAPEDHERAFAKFERINPQDTAGSGLGLYIARRLARAMKGDIRLDSAAGQGARFTLEIPARD